MYQPYNDDGSSDSGSGTSDSDNSNINNVPTAGNGTFYNLSGKVSGAAGGVTKFYATSRAGSARLIASGGDGGEPGQIEFGDTSLGEQAIVLLQSGGILSLSYHTGGLSIGSLTVNFGGVVKTQLGSDTTNLTLSGELSLNSGGLSFSFYHSESFALNTPYSIVSARNLSSFSPEQFSGNSVKGVQPTFTIEGDSMLVSFNG